MEPKQTNLTPPISIRNLGSSGVIMEDVVDEFLTPAGAVNWAINCHFDRIGSATVRQGLTILGAQIADTYTIKGLHQFLDTGAGASDRLLAVANTIVYALIAGTWTSKRTSLTANSKSRFTNFVDLVFMVNGAEAMESWDGGGGNFSTTNVSGAPAAKFIDNFRSRVWAAATTALPSRLYYSSVADASGAITWNTSTQYIDIAPGDGEDLTGIKKFATALYAFKPNTVYRIFSINQTEPDPVIFVGTYSQESVTVGKDGMYWHHPSGIYRLRKGESQPTEISRPIYDIIRNITRANYTEISSWTDDDHAYFHVGNVNVYGLTINNCVIRWTVSTEVWTIFSYAFPLVVGNTYDTSTGIARVVGDDDGNVYTFDDGTSDNGTAINYELETRWLNISGLRSEVKTIRKMTGLHEDMVGANVGWRNGTMNRKEIQSIGQLRDQESNFPNLNVTGNRIKLSIRGTSKAGSAVFQGWEIIDWLNEGVIK
jgi:hypothetical protein